jgi:hypothetical protein
MHSSKAASSSSSSSSSSSPAYSSKKKDVRKHMYWAMLANYTFSLCPPGFGTDTHRFWEALNAGAIPIVISSPLNTLYSQFPSIILDNWDELLAPDVLQAFRDRIVHKWGDRFHRNVTERLKMKYWIDQIGTFL